MGPKDRRRRRGRAVVTLATSALVAFPSLCAADEGGSAEALFQQARALVERGDYAGACPKLAESQRLEPALGTQFNLADCYEHVGRTATAHRLFEQVAGIAHAAGKFEREKSARQRAESLAPKLARVRFVVERAAPGLELNVDGATVPREAWSSGFAFDPGGHDVAATAPEHRGWEGRFEARASSTIDVRVPALVSLAPKPTASVRVIQAPPRRGPATATYVVGGAGVAALATGAAFGIVSMVQASDAEAACPKDVYAFRCPTPAGAEAWNSATTSGDVATVGFVAAGALLAGAAVLWWATTPKAARTTETALAPLLLQGRF